MISIVLPDLRGGGAERVMIDLGRAFALNGHKVEFVLMQAVGEFLPEVQKEFSVVELAAPRLRGVISSFAAYLRKRKPDAVIANMWPLTSCIVLGRMLSFHRCKLMLVEHSILSFEYASWGRLHFVLMVASIAATHRIADVVVAVSEGSARDTSRLAAMAHNRIKTLYNPVRQSRLLDISETSLANSLWNCTTGKRILTVGSLKSEKNHVLLLRAFSMLERTDAHLMLVGQGKCEAELRSLAAKLGVANRVIFSGFHADPSPFYATADLFVLSSDYEGFGNVIVEALSFGVPVVSTDCPSGPAEILKNGLFGRLVPVRDARALARAMDEALDGLADSDDLKRRAADFLPEIAARKYLELLDL